MKKNIYIIDDVQENLQVLRGILKQHGYNVSLARDGEKALAGISVKLPDLILLDISMPKMDGYQVCQHLKSNEKTAGIPIIFLTARTESEDIVRAFEVGGVDYLTKPFQTAELLVRIKTHLELKEAKEQLIELNRTKDKFFRIIAHDLKSPLSSIISFTDLFLYELDSFDKKQIRQYLLRLNQNTVGATKLLENLHAWARSQSGELSFNPEALNISQLIDENINLLEASAKEKNIQLIQKIDSNVELNADKEMISTILRNLISNAIKFTPTGGIVSIIVEYETHEVTVSVQDNGVGINEKNVQNLFRLDKHYTTLGTNSERGTGLGLMLCKEFIEKHEGKIWIESKEGIGTTVSFCLSTNT